MKSLRPYLIVGGIALAAAVSGCGHREPVVSPFHHGTTTYGGKTYDYDINRERGRISVDVYDGRKGYVELYTLRDNNGDSRLFNEDNDEAIEHLPSGERSYTLDRIVDEDGRVIRNTESPLDKPVINAAKGVMRNLRGLYRQILNEAGYDMAEKFKP